MSVRNWLNLCPFTPVHLVVFASTRVSRTWHFVTGYFFIITLTLNSNMNQVGNLTYWNLGEALCSGKAPPGFFLCIFRSITCLKKPVFIKGDLPPWKVPARLDWDRLNSGRFFFNFGEVGKLMNFFSEKTSKFSPNYTENKIKFKDYWKPSPVAIIMAGRPEVVILMKPW